MNAPTLIVWLLTPLVGLCGCAASPSPPPFERDPEVERLEAEAVPLPYRVAMAPLQLALFQEGSLDPSSRMGSPDRVALEADLKNLLSRYGIFQQTVLLEEGGDLTAWLQGARSHRAELLLVPRLTHWQLRFVERNDRWWWNTALWFTLLVPSFWPADETYGLEATLELELHTVRAGRLADRGRVEAAVTRDLDDFERGLDLWGALVGHFAVPESLELESWTAIEEELTPWARHALKKETLQHLVHKLKTRTETPRFGS